MDNFPPRTVPKPSTSGGFLGYPSHTRSLSPIKGRYNKEEGPLLLFEPSQRQLSNEEILKAELSHSNKNAIPTFYPTKNRTVKDSTMYYATNTSYEHTPALYQSFPAKYAGPLGRKKIYKAESFTQTESGLDRRHIGGLSEYTSWMVSEVDPFLQV